MHLQISKKKESSNTLLDTLAQLPPTALEKGNMETLKKRARSKWYTQKITLHLFDIESELNKYYSSAYHCNNILKQKGKEIKGKYCNSRICNVCNRIRTAKLMNGYINPLMELGDLEFTTLTLKNCKKQDLKATIEGMQKNRTLIFRKIREKLKIDFSGIVKIEVTYNPNDDTYHPHFHILSNQNTGSLIVDEWLKRYPSPIAEKWAQKVVTADHNSLKELFKYSTKFLVKDTKAKTLNIYVHALDTIMIALYKKRTFQTFGALKKIQISEDIEKEDLKTQIIEDIEEIENYKEWIYDYEGSDWYDSCHKPLTNYKPPDIEFQYFL